MLCFLFLLSGCTTLLHSSVPLQKPDWITKDVWEEDGWLYAVGFASAKEGRDEYNRVDIAVQRAVDKVARAKNTCSVILGTFFSYPWYSSNGSVYVEMKTPIKDIHINYRKCGEKETNARPPNAIQTNNIVLVAAPPKEKESDLLFYRSGESSPDWISKTEVWRENGFVFVVGVATRSEVRNDVKRRRGVAWMRAMRNIAEVGHACSGVYFVGPHNEETWEAQDGTVYVKIGAKEDGIRVIPGSFSGRCIHREVKNGKAGANALAFLFGIAGLILWPISGMLSVHGNNRRTKQRKSLHWSYGVVEIYRPIPA